MKRSNQGADPYRLRSKARQANNAHWCIVIVRQPMRQVLTPHASTNAQRSSRAAWSGAEVRALSASCDSVWV